MAGHHLQRVVDVGRGTCVGWASEKNRQGKRFREVGEPGDSRLAYQLRRLEQGSRVGRKKENGQKLGICVQGRRIPITNVEFQSLCYLHKEGTFMAQCGLWHKMDKKLVDIQNGGPDLFDELREAKLLHREDKRAHASRRREYERYGNVKSKTTHLKGAKRESSSVQVEICVDVDEQVEKLVRCKHLRRGNGDKQQIIVSAQVVRKCTQHGWSKLVVLVSSHVREEACARSEAALGASAGKDNKKGGEGSRHRLRKKIECRRGKFKTLKLTTILLGLLVSLF